LIAPLVTAVIAPANTLWYNEDSIRILKSNSAVTGPLHYRGYSVKNNKNSISFKEAIVKGKRLLAPIITVVVFGLGVWFGRASLSQIETIASAEPND
jgi:hypothetical protein